MRYAEVLNELKKGKRISWVQWGGTKYSIDFKTVSSATISKLKKNGLITVYRYKNAPLTGFIKLKVKQ